MKTPIFWLKLINDSYTTQLVPKFIYDIAVTHGADKNRAKIMRNTIEQILRIRLNQIDKDNPFVELDVYIENGYLDVAIQDKGVPYVLSKEQKKQLITHPDIMYHLDQLGTEGQRITFSFFIRRNVNVYSPELKNEKLLDDHIRIVKVVNREQDIIEAIKCIYNCYRYTYLHQEYYHIDRFKQMLRSGSFISIVAKNDHNQVLGHLSLMENSSFPGMFELGSLITKPFARGKNVANKLVDYAKKVIDKKKDAVGLFVEAVTFHPISQKIANSQSFVPTSFALQAIAPFIANRDLKEGRSHLALSTYLKDKKLLHTLYVPAKLNNFVQDIYKQLNIKLKLINADDKVNKISKSAYSYTADGYSRNATLIIDAVGRDIDNVFSTIDFDIGQNGSIDVISCYVNCNSTGSIYLYKKLIKNKFLFTGMYFGGVKGDYLLFTHLSTQPYDSFKPVLESNYRKLLDKIEDINFIKKK